MIYRLTVSVDSSSHDFTVSTVSFLSSQNTDRSPEPSVPCFLLRIRYVDAAPLNHVQALDPKSSECVICARTKNVRILKSQVSDILSTNTPCRVTYGSKTAIANAAIRAASIGRTILGWSRIHFLMVWALTTGEYKILNCVSFPSAVFILRSWRQFLAAVALRIFQKVR